MSRHLLTKECFLYCSTADIVFIVKDKTHPRFRREGINLVYTAKLPLVKALTGYTVEIHTLDERVIHIPITDIVEPGYKKMVPGEGMPITKDPEQHGDLIIEFEIEFPNSLTPDRKELLRKALTH